MSQKFVSASMLNYAVQQMIGLVNGKVDKVEGKGLSTNDLTEALKANYDAAYTHVSDKENPHGVTAEQVGLGLVPNVATNDQTPTFTPATTLETLASGETLSVSMGKMAKAISDEIAHLADKENPHEVTIDQVGGLAKELKGAANGLAELDENGLVPSAQLPSYVDDVVEVYVADGKAYQEEAHTTEVTCEAGKIYVDMADSKTYRWSGSTLVEISSSLALGETSSTAFRGDYGKVAYEHSQAEHARVDATKVEASATNGNIVVDGVETPVYVHPEGTNPHGTTAADVGLGNVPNVTTDNQTPTFAPAATLEALVSGETLSVSMGKIAKAILDEIEHFANKENPHEVTAAQVGLGNVDNTADAVKSVAHATTAGGLKTAVTINGVEFDGTKNIEIPVLGIVESAIKDGEGQDISATYIKGLSMSENVVTFTKGDGTTETFTAYVHPTGEGNYHVPAADETAKSNGYILGVSADGMPQWVQNVEHVADGPVGSFDQTTDGNTITKTFKVFGGASDGANGTPGFVPAPTAANTYLKGDGTWEAWESVTQAEVDAMFAGTYTE